MESSFRTLQSQLDKSNRKVSTAETILKNITQERDSAVSQLGVAYFTIEQLKVENEDLKDKNNQLKTCLDRLNGDHDDETRKGTAKEEARRGKLDRRTEIVRNNIEEGEMRPPGLQNELGPNAGHTEAPKRNVASSTHKEANTMFDLLPGRRNIDEASKGGPRTVQIDDSQESEDSVHEVHKANGIGKVRSPRRARNTQADEPSQNLTYLSFLEVRSLFTLALRLLTL